MSVCIAFFCSSMNLFLYAEVPVIIYMYVCIYVCMYLFMYEYNYPIMIVLMLI